MSLSIGLCALENSATLLMPNLNTFVGADVEVSVLVVGDHVDTAPVFPKLKGATAKFIKVSQVANVDTYSNLYQYILHLNKAGELIIPSVSAKVDGKEVKSNSLRLMVEDVVESDEVQLSVKFSKKEVYVGEPLLVTVQVVTKTPTALLKAMDITIPLLRDARFRSLEKRIGVVKKDEVGLPVNRTRVIANVAQVHTHNPKKPEETKSVFTFYKILVPLEAGDLKLSPSRIVYSREKNPKSQRRNYQWNRYPSYFSNNLFLNTTAADKYSRFKFTTPGFKLKVKPLPLTNKPSSFSGIITPFKVSLEANTVQMKVGDPISLSLIVKDALFLETLELPKLSQNPELTRNFSVEKQRSAAQLDVEHNRKVFHQTIRPLKVGVREIPPLRFSYFDTKDHKYHYAVTKAIPISVAANEAFSGFDIKFSDGTAIKNQLEEREEGLYFNYPESAIAENNFFTKLLNAKSLFWVVLLAPLFIKGLFEIFKATKVYRATHHYISTSAYRKFRRTPIRTEEQLYKAVTLYFSRRMHVDPKSLTFWDIEQVVEQDVDLSALKEFWESLDQSQFSSKSVKTKVDHPTMRAIKSVILQVEKKLPLLLMLLLFSVSSLSLQAESASSLFKKAEKVSVDNYEQGKTHYLVSAEKYLVEAKAYDSAESKGRLFYNAANAYYLADDLGHAMLYYLRAKQLIPNDHQLFMNLNFVKNERIDKIQSTTTNSLVESLLFFHYRLSPLHRFWCFVGLYFTLIAFLFYKKQNSFIKGIRMILIILTIMFATSIAINQHIMGPQQRGVIIAREITAFKGPGPLYEPAFLTSLHAGTTFKSLGKDGDWVWVELENGKQCWLSSKGLEFI